MNAAARGMADGEVGADDVHRTMCTGIGYAP